MKYFLCAALLALAGCQTARFPTPDPQAQLLTGQMHYVGAKRSFVGDFTARVSRSDFQFDVTKGPGVALFSIRESGDTLARFDGAGRSWQGNPQHFVPGQLQSWLALRDVLLGQPVPNVQVTRQGSRLTADFTKTGERFSFLFSL